MLPPFGIPEHTSPESIRYHARFSLYFCSILTVLQKRPFSDTPSHPLIHGPTRILDARQKLGLPGKRCLQCQIRSDTSPNMRRPFDALWLPVRLDDILGRGRKRCSVGYRTMGFHRARLAIFGREAANEVSPRQIGKVGKAVPSPSAVPFDPL